MPYTDDAAFLQDVRNAMVALVQNGVKSYRIGQREFTKNDLRELRELETDLMGRAVPIDNPDGILLARMGRAV